MALVVFSSGYTRSGLLIVTTFSIFRVIKKKTTYSNTASGCVTMKAPAGLSVTGIENFGGSSCGKRQKSTRWDKGRAENRWEYNTMGRGEPAT